MLLETKETIHEVFRLGAAYGFSADPPAGTFSSAVCLPSNEHPEGLPRLEGERLEKVSRDNQLSLFCAELGKLCEEAGLRYLVSNPLRSKIWKMSGWEELAKRDRTFIVDFCRFGTAWRVCYEWAAGWAKFAVPARVPAPCVAKATPSSRGELDLACGEVP